MGRYFGIVFGIGFTLTAHAGVLLFGGLLLGEDQHERTTQQVDLLSAEDTAAKKEEKKEEKLVEPTEELKAEEEPPPDAAEMLKNLELSALQPAPELEAASLSAITDALNGIAGGGEFGESLSFASGGRIGGTGKAGDLDQATENVFSMADIDQKPRAVFQAAPQFPSALRGKKLEGVVTLIFVVDAKGKVLDPRVEKSTHPAFERPALEALRQWKFEPGLKGGQRVPCKMRVPIRFQPS